jgi:DNA-binding response OmpR family regulator
MRAPVLLVEDDIKIARIIKAYLEGADFRVCHALSASEARQFFAHETPLAVILDLGLPDSPGEELCQEFKDSIDIPVLMVTAKSSEDERIAGFALGADDYLVKPASPRELVFRRFCRDHQDRNIDGVFELLTEFLTRAVRQAKVQNNSQRGFMGKKLTGLARRQCMADSKVSSF